MSSSLLPPSPLSCPTDRKLLFTPPKPHRTPVRLPVYQKGARRDVSQRWPGEAWLDLCSPGVTRGFSARVGLAMGRNPETGWQRERIEAFCLGAPFSQITLLLRSLAKFTSPSPQPK